MCGIAGIINLNGDPVSTSILQRMTDAIAHRGPDDAGTYSSDSGGILGHRRLSIMDPRGGHQPIERIGDDCAIAANGG